MSFGRHIVSVLFAASLALTLSYCSEPSGLSNGPSQESIAAEASANAQTSTGLSRWDAPHWNWSDNRLIEEVANSDGIAIVGFKEPDADAGVRRGDVLVSTATVAEGIDELRGLGLTTRRDFGSIPAVSVRMDPEDAPRVRDLPRVEYVEPNGSLSLQSQDTTWSVERVSAPDAWVDGYTGSGAKLMILDSGVNSSHRDLSANIVAVLACDGSDGEDEFGHGTYVAGIAAAVDNSYDVIGAAPSVGLYSVKITDPDVQVFYEEAECGVQLGIDHDVDVINMSFGNSQVSTSLTDKIQYAYHYEYILFVGAAGNTDDSTGVLFPANLSEVIAVNATDTTNVLWTNAPEGPEVEISAPGVNILSTAISGGTSWDCGSGSSDGGGGGGDDDPIFQGSGCSGTSYSAPLVAAAAALLHDKNRYYSNDEIRYILETTAADLGYSESQAGAGLLDISGALNYESPPNPAVDISGPARIRDGDTCTWWAEVDGGTPPYTYEWINDGAFVSDSASYTGGNLSTTREHFELWLTVSDAAGAYNEKRETIYEASDAPLCFN